DVTALDADLRRAREVRDAARRAAEEAARRRDEQEQKIETLRQAQERRKQMVEFVRTPKDGATLMADIDLARQVLAKEEAEWLRAADGLGPLEVRVAEEERRFAEIEAVQSPRREAIAASLLELAAARAARLGEREEKANQLERTLRMRYDRLRRARASSVVVPLSGDACGACFTAVPRNRRSQIRAGVLLEGCEACGVILYSADR
ncbi:MAG: zinc ribbon domain-containing protein, partial [Gemmatimonadales bacterium]